MERGGVASAGWKGKGLWSTYVTPTPFQPDPLAR